MAVKVLFFGVDELYQDLKPLYTNAVKNGELKIIAYAKVEDEKITWFDAEGDSGNIGDIVFDFAILSSNKNFYRRMKMLKNLIWI